MDCLDPPLVCIDKVITEPNILISKHAEVKIIMQNKRLTK